MECLYCLGILFGTSQDLGKRHGQRQRDSIFLFVSIPDIHLAVLGRDADVGFSAFDVEDSDGEIAVVFPLGSPVQLFQRRNAKSVVRLWIELVFVGDTDEKFLPGGEGVQDF